jgi:RsiW-degrading membrane proteinase PrsW (M82 family)
MVHIPVNHHLRPLYRTITALVGLYVLVFGITGAVETAGSDLFDRGDTTALGLRTNLAFSILSIAVGVVILGAVLLGRNIDQLVSYWGGFLFLIIPTLMMALLRTEGNFLNFSMTTVVVSYVIGLLLLAAGLYSKAGSEEDKKRAEGYRYSQH